MKRNELRGALELDDVRYVWTVAPHYPSPAFMADAVGCAPVIVDISPEPTSEDVRAIVAHFAESAARRTWRPE